MAKTNIKVKLVGEDGNAYSILGRVRNALRRGGRPELVDEFIKEATSGNYDHLLQTVLDYVEEDDAEDFDEDIKDSGEYFNYD